MSTLIVRGEEIELTDDGYLKNPDVWSRDVAEAYAEKDDLKLTDEHWEIINFLREYYNDFEFVPPIDSLIKHLKDPERIISPGNANLAYIYELFPEGPKTQGSKYAGLPKPRSCCTSV